MPNNDEPVAPTLDAGATVSVLFAQGSTLTYTPTFGVGPNPEVHIYATQVDGGLLNLVEALRIVGTPDEAAQLLEALAGGIRRQAREVTR